MTAMRKFLVLLSVLVLVTAACSSDDTADTSTTQATATSETSGDSGSETATTEPPPSGEPTTIRYFEFSSSPDHLDEIDAMVAAFEAENPDVRVDVEHGTFDDYHTVLQTQIAGDDAPDAFELNFENFVSFATKGTLADLGPLAAADPDFDAGAYYGPAYDAFGLDGVQYGLPESYSTVLLFFNKELFDAAGIDYPTDDWNWADERSAAETIAATGDNVWGFFAGVHYWEFYKAAFQNGCPFFGDDGSVPR
jgi:multiple sugar transport system substrate-binding protein